MKGRMVKILKEHGIRKDPETLEKLERVKTHKIINLYYKEIVDKGLLDSVDKNKNS
jgi:hypothetical protein